VRTASRAGRISWENLIGSELTASEDININIPNLSKKIRKALFFVLYKTLEQVIKKPLPVLAWVENRTAEPGEP
jgi:hypothetical protein